MLQIYNNSNNNNNNNDDNNNNNNNINNTNNSSYKDDTRNELNGNGVKYDTCIRRNYCVVDGDSPNKTCA